VSEIPGGGRIGRDDDAKSISIFGFSYGFGKGDHALAAEMCTAEFPGYTVSLSDDGY
jgi:phosphohistidine phosphatase